MHPSQTFRREAFTWELRSRSLVLGCVTQVMGILNVTPDSFSDGGSLRSTAEAVETALKMFDDGAAIVDIGGESTRPGAAAMISDNEELDRVLPVIEGIRGLKPDALLSIDTYRAVTARAAVTAGAEIVNDVSGLLWDSAMASTCAELGCGVVAMHTRGRPAEWKTLPRLEDSEVLPLVLRELAVRKQAALDAGIRRERLVLDPGFGFGKAFESNYPLLARLHELRSLGQPLLAGVSRKAFLGRTLGRRHAGPNALAANAPPGNAQPQNSPARDVPADARTYATVAAITAAVLNGADLVRVHEVKAAVDAVAIADAVLSATE
jgi:dihydropteroate synthase